jgi:asparagine synthase (glutamine-hydrolysing)
LQSLNLILRKSERYILQTAYGSVENASLLFPRISINQAFDQRRQVFSETAEKSDLKKRKYELMSYLPDLLMRQDKMSMAHSIENRVTFLDNEMLDFALTQSEEDLYGQYRNKWEGKIPLKESCSAIFGKDFSYRSKMGFGIPLKSFFQSEVFQERWKSKILPGIKKRGMFNVNQLDNWMKSLSTLNEQQIDSIWLMVGFEIWATQYLD